MYTFNQTKKTTLLVNKAYEGESIEQKVNRIVNNKEPIKDGAPLIYSNRKDGVQPQYDIRTDRFELAVDAMNKVSATHLAKRDYRLGEEAKKNMDKETKTETKNDGGAEPTQGTSSTETK